MMYGREVSRASATTKGMAPSSTPAILEYPLTWGNIDFAMRLRTSGRVRAFLASM